jgi:hypothetical protein
LGDRFIFRPTAELQKAALGYDDCRIRRFAASRQFKRDSSGVLQGQGFIRKYVTNFVPECG